MQKWKVAVTLGLVCFILVVSIFIQIKTVEEATEEVGTQLSDNAELKDELLKVKAEYEASYKELEKAKSKLEEARTTAVSNNDSDVKLEEELKKNQKILGLTEVKGAGIIITLDDTREVDASEVWNINDYLVHEEDLIQIINELFNSGAEAISINGQRVVSTTSILCDGSIIRINGEKVGVPIEIKAIGYPERLYYALVRPGGWLVYMARDGVKVSYEKAENIVIPKYEGVFKYEYIK